MAPTDHEKPAPETSGEVVIYPGKDGRLRVQTRMALDTAWVTQKQMAELFGVQPPAISKHLKNIFEIGELAESAVVSKMETTATAAQRRRDEEEVAGVLESIGGRKAGFRRLEKQTPMPKNARRKKGHDA